MCTKHIGLTSALFEKVERTCTSVPMRDGKVRVHGSRVSVRKIRNPSISPGGCHRLQYDEIFELHLRISIQARPSRSLSKSWFASIGRADLRDGDLSIGTMVILHPSRCLLLKPAA